MAKPGPKKTPTRILKLHGSRWAKGRVDIEIPAAMPECPDWLNDVARAHWAEIVPEIAKSGLLARVDGPRLALLCLAWADLQEANKHCQSSVIKTVIGNLVQNPLLSIRNKAEERYNKLASLFGMSIADRAGMGSAQKTKTTKSKARFFQKGGDGA